MKNSKIFIFTILLLFLVVVIYYSLPYLSKIIFKNTTNSNLVKSSVSQNIMNGIPAIKPELTKNGPMITEENTRAYIAAHPFNGGITTTGQQPTIDKIFFTTVNYVTANLAKGAILNISPNEKVLIVVEDGPFRLSNSVWNSKEVAPVAKKVYRVFNSRTGNYFMWGVLN